MVSIHSSIRLNMNGKYLKICLLFMLMTGQLMAQVDTAVGHIEKIEKSLLEHDKNPNIGLLTMIAYRFPLGRTSLGSDIGDEYWTNNREKLTRLYIKYFDEALENGFRRDFDYASLGCVRWNVIVVGDEQEMKNNEIRRKNNEYYCQQQRLAEGVERVQDRFNCFYKYSYQREGTGFKAIRTTVREMKEAASIVHSDEVLQLMKESKRKWCRR